MATGAPGKMALNGGDGDVGCDKGKGTRDSGVGLGVKEGVESRLEAQVKDGVGAKTTTELRWSRGGETLRAEGRDLPRTTRPR